MNKPQSYEETMFDMLPYLKKKREELKKLIKSAEEVIDDEVKELCELYHIPVNDADFRHRFNLAVLKNATLKLCKDNLFDTERNINDIERMREREK